MTTDDDDQAEKLKVIEIFVRAMASACEVAGGDEDYVEYVAFMCIGKTIMDKYGPERIYQYIDEMNVRKSFTSEII